MSSSVIRLLCGGSDDQQRYYPPDTNWREGQMSDELKQRVLEIVSISKECPDNLQALCFELLLKEYLESRRARPTPAASTPPPVPAPAPPAEEQPPVEPLAGETTTGQQDLRTGDLHIKARKFMEKYSLSLDHLNQLFYKDGAQIKPLYEDLKTTRMAEGQIRVTLLHALLAGMTTGDFAADGEAVRTEVQQRKSYDSPNFTKNFRNNASLFDGFESYEKGAQLRLSEDGRKELAELIKELAR
jgi:hypothetical protein